MYKLNKDFKESYGIDYRNPQFEGEESLNPQTEEIETEKDENINIDQAYFSIFELKRKYDRTELQTWPP